MTVIADEPEPLRRLLTEVLLFLPDVARMFTAVVRDERVPRAAKLRAAALLALGATPLNIIPVVGQLELAAAVGLAARQLVKHAGEDVLREHWAGTDEGYQVLMLLVASGLWPRRLLWRPARHR